MYLTAHRVRTADGEEAVQAFLYEHDAEHPWPASPSEVINKVPGQLVKKHTPIKPGGNVVLSYLDVVSPVELGAAPLDTALRGALDLATSGAPGVIHPLGTVFLRFGTVGPIGSDADRRAEYLILVDAALELLQGGR